MNVSIVLPDGSSKEFDHKPTVLEVAESIGPRLAKATVGGLLGPSKDIVDLRTELENGSQLTIITTKDEQANDVILHSAAHILAQAVQELWPETKITFGPALDHTFFYDFDSPHTFTTEDLEKIEKRMKDIVRRDLPIERSFLDSKKAVGTFEEMGEKYKAEHIGSLEVPQVSIYKQGEWFDLCSGPHVQRTGQVKAVKLLSLAGAYWKGDENNPQLQRIYGTAFASQKALDEHLRLLEEAKKRDHRRLGKDLGLFHFHENAPGSPFFTGQGAVIYRELQNYLREMYEEFGYKEVITPQVFDVDLYHQSGHYDNYRENMYFTEVDGRLFSLKPMNCPGHCLLYNMDHWSYRDLPLRIADFGRLHRYERSGTMHGLTRVRTFCQDDAHIFCTSEQLLGEIQAFMKLLNRVYNQLGMTEYQVYLSTRPEKRLGSDEIWDKAEQALEEALKSMNLDYQINEGDGAFYGPKLDIMFVDALKRPWQLGTLQCDFNMPERFSLSYIGSDNQSHQPIMLHRAILGSLERFIGVYLEHCAGHLPPWLAPEQVRILNVTERAKEFGDKLYKDCRERGIRVHFDDRNEKLGFKIREAQLHKVPYMVVIGDKEVEDELISVRLKDGRNRNSVKPQAFYDQVLADIRCRRLAAEIEEENT